MGILSRYKQRKKETKAYKQILSKKLEGVRRRAYAEEAEKVAIEKAKAKARAPSLGRRIMSVATTQKKVSPIRRRKIKRILIAQRKRTKRKRTTFQKPRQPQNVMDLLYGGN